jgi:hypothetical protein
MKFYENFMTKFNKYQPVTDHVIFFYLEHFNYNYVYFLFGKFPDEAAGFLHQAGALSIVSSISSSSEFAEIEAHKTSLLERLEKFRS